MGTAWAALIDHAFEQWEKAARYMITVTRVSGSCNVLVMSAGTIVSVGTIVEVPISSTNPTAVGWALYNGSNEVYMVNPAIAPLAAFVSASRWALCIRFAEACVISPRYGDHSKGTATPLETGSVDVLVNTGRAPSTGGYTLSVPSGDVTFNRCDKLGQNPTEETDGDRKRYLNYELMVHEAGHALGLSENTLVGTFRRHDPVAHPLRTTDTVMNYNGEVRLGGVNEPDCSPHPLDILAIHALYQASDRGIGSRLGE